MNQPTPGPWKYDEESGWVVNGWFGIHQVPTGNMNSRSQHEANARLIVQAPAMREALAAVVAKNTAVRLPAEFANPDEWIVITGQAFDTARAILTAIDG